MLLEWTLMKEQYTSTKSIKAIAKEHNIPYVKLLRLNKQINKRIPEDQIKYIQEQIDKYTVVIKEEEEKEKVIDTKIDTIVKLEPYINDIIKRIQYLEQKEDREPPRDVLFIIVLMLMLFLNFIKVFGVRYI